MLLLTYGDVKLQPFTYLTVMQDTGQGLILSPKIQYQL